MSYQVGPYLIDTYRKACAEAVLQALGDDGMDLPREEQLYYLTEDCDFPLAVMVSGKYNDDGEPVYEPVDDIEQALDDMRASREED